MKDACAEGQAGARPNINVTPLIDILLVLLIIFMVVTPLRPARFKALVPEPPENSVEVMSPRTLVVSVEGDGALRLTRGATTVAEGSIEEPGEVASGLAREWRARIAAGSWKEGFESRADLAPDLRVERTVFVRAPRSLRYGEVARVIDAVKGAGADPVGLQTDELPN
jgi:biopolymer transport protein ExbD